MEMSYSLLKEWRNDLVNDIIIDESFLIGIIWLDYENLIIELDWVGQKNIYEELDLTNKEYRAYLAFEWVCDIEIKMKYEALQIGMPEISKFSFLRLENDTKQVKIDFFHQPHGKISFGCNDLRFVIEEIK